jgi:hypothetical protein
MRDRRVLLSELEDYRWFVFAELADLAEEEGDADQAAGWRWLAEFRKWPAHRRRTGAGERRYAWVATDRQEGLTEHELPGELYGLVYPRRDTWGGTTLSGLLAQTAGAVGRWLRRERR